MNSLLLKVIRDIIANPFVLINFLRILLLIFHVKHISSLLLSFLVFFPCRFAPPNMSFCFVGL